MNDGSDSSAGKPGRTTVYRVAVEFGDCDPAGIVWFPNFFRWFDAASRHFFRQCGVPPWRELEAQCGILGTPLLETTTRFVRPASYDDRIEVHSTIVEWNPKTFVQRHVIRRGDEVLAEAREVRAFVTRHPDDDRRMRAVPVPDDIRALCT